MKVYFSHGKESGPWGSKIKRLADKASSLGFSVDSLDYTDSTDPDVRANKLADLLKYETQPFLLVGSSMGGYVSVVAAEQTPPKGIFLLAPALYIPEYQVQQYCQTLDSNVRVEVVHGWNDNIIPFAHSVRFAQERDCFLHLIPGDHRLNSSIIEVEKLFTQFLGNFLCSKKEKKID